jgi:putative hemolysin
MSSINTSLLAEIGLPLLLFFVALSIRAIFAFLETTVTALRLFKLKELAQITGGRYSKLFYTLEKQPHRVIITTLIASSTADVTAAALATHVTETLFKHINLPDGLGFSLGIGLASIAIIVFGEVIPKHLARSYGERMIGSLLWIINGVFYFLQPVATILIKFSDALIYVIEGHKPADKKEAEAITSEREVKFLIEYVHAEGLMEPEKSAMLCNIFELGNTPVKEICVPSVDIVLIDIATPVQDALKIFSKYRFTRLPVYQNNQENIIGMVHLKDLFELLFKREINKSTREASSGTHDQTVLKDILRPIIFVPESVKVNQLLREFRQKHMHIAIVLNEHGTVTGLITLEDVLEEIVGEISDEHESITAKIVPLAQGGWQVNAGITLEELEGFLNIPFPAESSLTLAGFMIEQLQHLPKKGEKILYRDYWFIVEKANTRRIQQITIKKNG